MQHGFFDSGNPATSPAITYPCCMFITLTGTESTGKTNLALALAQHYKALLLPDVSRTYIEQLTAPPTEKDVLNIAQEILQQEHDAQKQNLPFIISDNCLLNIKIWLHYYSWETPLWLAKAIQERQHYLHLLCATDVKWVPDAQRKNETDRLFLFRQFEKEMKTNRLTYSLVTGLGPQRLTCAINNIEGFKKHRN
jgi:nicotinamide riboside kinase